MYLSEIEREGYAAALQSAHTGAAAGGVPIGSALTDANGLIATGHNRRVQDADATAHAEITALRAAGRRSSYRDITLHTALAPCALCAGAIVQFKIPRVIVGEDSTFGGELDWLRERGVRVLVLNDPDATKLMGEFIARNPDLWREDIAEAHPASPNSAHERPERCLP